MSIVAEPDLVIICKCGNSYSLHTYTVCPVCFEWPSRSVPSEKPYGMKCTRCAGIGCIRCRGTGWEGDTVPSAPDPRDQRIAELTTAVEENSRNSTALIDVIRQRDTRIAEAEARLADYTEMAHYRWKQKTPSLPYPGGPLAACDVMLGDLEAQLAEARKVLADAKPYIGYCGFCGVNSATCEHKRLRSRIDAAMGAKQELKS
jgi:hypothetical protein